MVPTNLSGVIAIATVGVHSLALTTNGTVVAWGLNDYGQSTVPTNLANVVAIAAGHYHSLALKSDGTVVAWGAGAAGQSASPHYGQSAVPTNLRDVIAIAAGETHSLALVLPVVRLQIQLSGTNVVLCWPSSLVGFVLETTDGLSPTNSWTTVTNAPAIVDSYYTSQFMLTNQLSDGNRFYRLRK